MWISSLGFHPKEEIPAISWTIVTPLGRLSFIDRANLSLGIFGLTSKELSYFIFLE
jgi:hypothetical protein|tara:strand:- start:3262 stop:3429 length:168 start_codon:yes stop_codon:yes gene_type:complete